MNLEIQGKMSILGPISLMIDKYSTSTKQNDHAGEIKG